MSLIHKFSTYSLLPKKIIFGLGLLFCLAVILEIWLTNRLSTYGEEIAKIEQASTNLEVENQILMNQADQKSSLVEIKNQAAKLGFETMHNVQYLQGVSVALNSR